MGNICRSPIVELVLRRKLQDRGVIVESAGIAAMDGECIDRFAQAVLNRHQIDASTHMARRLDRAMLDEADLVLVMERKHLDFIRSCVPSAAGKTFLLGKWQGECEIPDPLGKPMEAFDRLYQSIEIAADSWCEVI